MHHRYVIPRLQGGGGSDGIWGCISHKGIGYSSIYTGRINQYSYRDTLENALKPSAQLFYNNSSNFLFQQDGAPAHTAKSITQYLSQNNISVLPWCARSLDLNLIENIWAWMDANMVKVKVTSIEHLKDVLESLWLSITKTLCMSLIESMPRRVKLCYKANGGYFRY